MIVLLDHFQIIVNVIECYALVRTFVVNGTELCASVFVARFPPDKLRFYISQSCWTTVKHSFWKNFFNLIKIQQNCFSDGFY